MPTRMSDAAAFWLFLALAVATIGWHANALPLFHEEPRRALVAQEMLLTGDYATPTIYQRPYVKKPPLQNWAIALASQLPGGPGVSSLAARLPTMVAWVALGAGVFLFLRRCAPKADAALGACAAMTPAMCVFDFARKSEPDLLLTALTFASFAIFMAGPLKRTHQALSGFAMGLAILAKGVGPLFVYPGLVVYAVWLAPPEPSRWRLLRGLGLSGLWALVLPAGWLAAYALQGDVANLLGGFTAQAGARAQGGLWESVQHLLVYPLVAAGVLLPWTAVAALYWRRLRWPTDPAALAAGCCLGTSLLIWSLLPGSVDRYFLPASPFFGVLLACCLAEGAEINPLAKKVFLAVAGLVCLGGFGLLVWLGAGLGAAWLLLPAAGVLFYARLETRALTPGVLAMASIVLLLSVHGYFQAKAITSADYAPIAAEIAALADDPALPLVVDDTMNPIQLAVELVRLRGRLVYKPDTAPDGPHYLLSSAVAAPGCETLGSVPYPKQRLPEIFVLRCGGG